MTDNITYELNQETDAQSQSAAGLFFGLHTSLPENDTNFASGLNHLCKLFRSAMAPTPARYRSKRQLFWESVLFLATTMNKERASERFATLTYEVADTKNLAWETALNHAAIAAVLYFRNVITWRAYEDALDICEALLGRFRDIIKRKQENGFIGVTRNPEQWLKNMQDLHAQRKAVMHALRTNTFGYAAAGETQKLTLSEVI